MRDHHDGDDPEDAAHHGPPTDLPVLRALTDPDTLRHRPSALTLRIHLVQRPDDEQPWAMVSETDGLLRPLLLTPSHAAVLGRALVRLRGQAARPHPAPPVDNPDDTADGASPAR